MYMYIFLLLFNSLFLIHVKGLRSGESKNILYKELRYTITNLYFKVKEIRNETVTFIYVKVHLDI